jgi:hypothetical protein
LTVAAADIGNRSTAAQRGINVWQSRDPLLAQEVAEAWRGKALEATPEPVSVVCLRDTPAMLKSVGQLVDVPPERLGHDEQ